LLSNLNPRGRSFIRLPRHPIASRRLFPAFALAAVLVLSRPLTSRAQNSLSYEYEDYDEPDGRVGVTTQTARADQDLGTDMHVALTGVIDAIAGATPTGQPAPKGSDQVPTSYLHDYRKAWEGDFAGQMPNFNVAVGFSRSIEGDYESNGYSVNTLTDFNQKNTTLLVGVAGTDDNVETFFGGGWVKKYDLDFIVGVTQLLDPLTSVTLNATVSHEHGFLNDQYKLVEKDFQVLPGIFLPATFAESRPGVRTKGDLYASINRSVPGLHGALEASYRLYHDTYGITANTAELAWFQHLGPKFILKPDIRLYQQNAADFYIYNLNNSEIAPTGTPSPNGPHYSSDARLSVFREADCSLKLIWIVADWLQFDGSIGGYTQRGTDGVTPQSAYYRAMITTGGAKVSW
jgi:hypothetical protein